MILKFYIFTRDKINHDVLIKACSYFTAIVQQAPNAIIVGYDTYIELQQFDIQTIYGLDILVDFNIADGTCNMCLRL